MGRLDGKVAIITGAARGTGAETARLFVAEGARVLLVDLRDELGAGVAGELGDAARYQHLDVTSASAWAAGVEVALDAFGQIDILVNNAAILEVRAFLETTPETFSRLMAVNQLGPFLGMQAVVPHMKEAGGGSIVNVSSIDGLEGSNGVAAYTSTKWGLRGLTKATSQELGRHRIRVNTVCPNPGSQEMSEPFYAEALERIKARTDRLPDRPQRPFGREGDVRDVANAILFLASDDSGFVNGADLAVDGGWTAGKIEPGAPMS